MIKIVFDYRGLGDAFPQFLSQPWTDPSTNKEYPPLVLDDDRSIINKSLPILRPVIANAMVNQQMISATTVALEQESLELPVNSRQILGNKLVQGDDDSEETEETGHRLTMEEKAIFVETDALQIEMGNVVSKKTSAGTVVYDVAKSTQHKDRYSALAMALRYIAEIEEVRKKKYSSGTNAACVGVVTRF